MEDKKEAKTPEAPALPPGPNVSLPPGARLVSVDQARLQAVISQRNSALDAVADHEALLTVVVQERDAARKELDTGKARVTELEAKVAELTPPDVPAADPATPEVPDGNQPA